SNAITVVRSLVDGGIINTTTGEDTLSIVVGDNVIDSIDITLLDNLGDSSIWVVSDTSGIVLDITDGPPFIFEGAGSGICLIQHLSGSSNLSGLTIGGNISEILGCHDFSNTITIIRTEVNGGVIATPDSLTAVSLCIVEQMDALVDATLTDTLGTDFAWIITDANGDILELPSMPPFNFGAAPSGLCQIWHLASIGPVTGLTIGENVSNLGGSYDLSNAIDVTRSSVDGGVLMTTTNEDTLMIIANDGISDAFDVTLVDTVGDSLDWIITNESGIIVGLPDAPPFDLEGAGAGICQLWNISYNDSIVGISIGASVDSLVGCFDFSNPITIIREVISGGTITTIDTLVETTVCLSDTFPDLVDVLLNDASGTNSAWIISDTTGLILNLPAMPPFDFSNAGTGVCQIWHISYENGLVGLEVDSSLNNLNGIFNLSNNIIVNRDSLSGGDIVLDNGLTSDTITVGDGIIDSINVNLTNSVGDSMIYVITDTLGVIVDIVDGPPFTFENAGGGVCQIWHLSYSDGITGLVIGENVSNLNGCFDFSNPINIVRQGLMGGNLTTINGETEVTVCTGDDISDAIDVILTDTLGPVYTWVITDENGIILELPPMPPFEFENAGAGVCQVWNLTHEATITGLNVDANIADLIGNFNFSNPITVTREESSGGSLMTVDSLVAVTITVAEGITDTIDVILSDTLADNYAWVITDTFGVIMDLPTAPPFFFENAGGGVCQIWNLSFSDGLTGLTIGENIDTLVGCHDFSNAIEVTRIPTILNGGNITTDDFLTTVDLCVGDGISMPIDVLISDNEGPNEQWLVTDTSGLILGLPSSLPIDLELAGGGVCQIWNLAYSNGLEGLVINENISGFVGFFDFSNPIVVNRTSVDGGELITTTDTTEVTIMVGDGIIDSIDVVLTGSEGEIMSWVITDTLGNILSLPTAPPFTFETLGAGVCQIWNISYASGLTGLTPGSNISGLNGCFAISNPITVNREGLNGGLITDLNGNTTTSVCLSTGSTSLLDIMLADTSGTNYQLIVTDTIGEILALPFSSPIDFSTSSSGQCFVFNMAYDTLPGNLVVGDSIANLTGIYSLSNSLIVNKEVVEGGSIALPNNEVTDTIDVDDGVIDSIFVNLSSAIGDSMQWVITDTLGNIIALPDAPPFTFENAGGGVCQIWNLSYLTGLTGLAVGNNVSQLVGCFEFSNPVTIVREGLSGGFITFPDGTTYNEICFGDGIADFIDVNVTGAQGDFQEKFATSADGQIFVLNAVFPFNFENIPINLDTFIIYNISYDVLPGGLNQGSFISNLTGEFALSNGCTLFRKIVKGGTIVDDQGLTSSTVLVGDGIPDTLSLTLTGEFGDSLTWVITNESDTIIGFANSSEFTYPDNTAPGTDKIYHAAIIADEVSGLAIGEPIDSIIGCHDFSNAYTITKKVLNGGMITTTAGETEVTLCVGNGGNDFVNVVTTGELGVLFSLVVTNTNGLIEQIPTSSQIDFPNQGVSLVYNISHDNTLTGLQTGQNISNLGGCFQLSNSLMVTRISVFASTLSFDGTTSDTISICTGDQVDDILQWEPNAETPNFVYAITDTLGIIDTIISNNVFNFETSPGEECRIYSISYVGDLNAMPGDTITQDDLAGICHLVSANFLTVIKDNCTKAANFTYKVFPNPAVDELTLDLRKRPFDESKVFIYNGTGKMVLEQKVDITKNKISISEFEPGIYYMRIMSKGMYEMQKFIIIE
ncbi:MAG: T9SS type A sorting domain-containing protein, partial [Bacteroidia bacterium]|nr:T9SS type A sorting domain-containing protein [Bacteroidia bacterium]